MSFKKYTPYTIYSILRYIYSLGSYQKYKPLLHDNSNLINKHTSQRCFILGSGNSIKKQDLRPLQNEVVISLNNFFVHDEYTHIMSSNVEKYHIVAPIHTPQSTEEWFSWLNTMDQRIPNNVIMFLGLNSYKANIREIKKDLFSKKKIHWYFSSHFFNLSSGKLGHGTDITRSLISAETVSIHAIIIAISMGFKEIYLLGMDHDYFLYDSTAEMRMYDKAEHQNDEMNRAFGQSFYIDELYRQYVIFKKYKALSLNSSSKIYNASSGGILKVFERVNYEDIISK